MGASVDFFDFANWLRIKGGCIVHMQPFQKITDASKITGLSAYFLRKGCKEGTIPHIKSGGVYYINVPALLRGMGADEFPKGKV